MTCKYYRETSRGKRCIFLSRRDWQTQRTKYINMCLGDPKKCPVYNRYENILNSKDFYRKPQNGADGLSVTPDADIKPTKANADQLISDI
jgi:hypothetical protein